MGFSPCSTFSFGRPPPLALSGAYFNTFAMRPCTLVMVASLWFTMIATF